MIQKQRELYEAPTTQLINLRIESGILTVSDINSINDWVDDGDPLAF